MYIYADPSRIRRVSVGCPREPRGHACGRRRRIRQKSPYNTSKQPIMRQKKPNAPPLLFLRIPAVETLEGMRVADATYSC